MIKTFITQLKANFCLLFFLTFLTGGLYPLMVTSVSQWLFPSQANGSLIYHQNKIQGSRLIGQYFSHLHYFWGRPSATPDFPYNSAYSKSANYGPLQSSLQENVANRRAYLQKFSSSPIPLDLITTSGSGLDPHITVPAAIYQIPRIAKARRISEKEVETLISSFIEKPTWGLLGEARLNVLQLNLALDTLSLAKQKEKS